MKKIISRLIVVSILMSVVLMCVNATEVYTITSSDAIDLACSVFPEYEDQIRGKNAPRGDSLRNRENNLLGEIVVQKTRISNDGEVFTYQEDARGVVVVDFTYGSTLVDSSSGSGYINRKCDLVMYCNVSDEILHVKGFQYSLVQSEYDRIVNYGTTINSTATVDQVTGNKQETANTNAFVRYYVSFTANKHGLSGEVRAFLQAVVGNESCSYSAHEA